MSGTVPVAKPADRPGEPLALSEIITFRLNAVDVRELNEIVVLEQRDFSVLVRLAVRKYVAERLAELRAE